MTTFYAVLDENMLPIAWYNDDVYPSQDDGSPNSDIPAGAVVLTAAQWQDCINNPGLRQITVANGVASTVVYTPTAPPPTVAELIAYAKVAQAAFLQIGQTFNVAASGQPAVNVLCDGSNNTRADLSLLALYGQANPDGSKVWLDNNGVSTTMTSPQLVTLATLAGDWISDTYPSLISLIGEIMASPPTVTTLAQIDAYAWPTS